MLINDIGDLDLGIHLTNGDIQTGSRDYMRTDFCGMHLSITARIFSSRTSTALFMSTALKTSLQSSVAGAM